MKRNNYRYLCTLPSPETNSVQPNSFPESVEPFSVAKIASLLQPLTESCLYINKGWWSYEFCYLRQIRQYHKAQAEGEVNEDLLVGIYDPVASDDLNQKENSRFFLQKYSDGDSCDLNNLPREATVQIYCLPGAVDEIVDVLEVSTCKYLITVATSRICPMERFSRQAVPISKIECTKIISDLEYESALVSQTQSSNTPRVESPQTNVDTSIFNWDLKGNKKLGILDVLFGNSMSDESSKLSDLFKQMESELFDNADKKETEELAILRKILKTNDEDKRKKKQK